MKSTLFTILLLTIGQLHAQKIETQFTELMENTETFKDYKVIKISELNQFWNTVTDTISSKKITISDLRNENNELEERLTKVNNNLEVSEGTVAKLNEQISTIDVVGLSIDKTVFKAINFSLLLTLSGLLIFSFLKLKERIATANKKVKAYEKLEMSFEDFKKEALEKQMKLRRELQTERNKLEEIRSTI